MTPREQWLSEGMQQGIQQGMQQSIQQGIQRARHFVAQNMLRRGLSESEIAACTGLELSEVVALRKKNEQLILGLT